VSEVRTLPRLLFAGLSGGSGKTLVSLGLLLSLHRAGVAVRAFKKGPDYIDPAWLGWASGYAARNLDTFLMGFERVGTSFFRSALTEGINVIEGARGLFDGFDVVGSHSTAALGKLLQAPTVLVVDCTKMTRTAAALVLGCQTLDPQIPIRGVILNNVNGHRHEQLLRSTVTSTCGVPVLGVLPRLADGSLPERHLGLVPPTEHLHLEKLERDLLEFVGNRIDLKGLVEIARGAPPLQAFSQERTRPIQTFRVRIGYLRDVAFHFYYPENLEQLEKAGAELIPISSMQANALPDDLNALYIGGGFPETHAEALAANRAMLHSLRVAAEAGMPIYAECGGLMLLSRSLLWKGVRYEMAHVFPFDVEVSDSPQGHGYSELYVDTRNPFFSVGTALRGHEFHYSAIVTRPKWSASACEVRRGTGCFEGRDAAIIGNVWASYTHLHALATPEWASGLLAAARQFASHSVHQ
jgi:cobyrinic acid a,c-diamide synthase